MRVKRWKEEGLDQKNYWCEVGLLIAVRFGFRHSKVGKGHSPKADVGLGEDCPGTKCSRFSCRENKSHQSGSCG